MKCPNDSATLVMSERSGVEIDYCPECRGVWLDRGELDKILDRAESEFAKSAPQPTAAPTAAPPQQPYSQPSYGQQYDDRNRYDRDRDRDGYRPKKKDNWLGELFG
jgi:Zn-finger nucleic acid-binding protein